MSHHLMVWCCYALFLFFLLSTLFSFIFNLISFLFQCSALCSVHWYTPLHGQCIFGTESAQFGVFSVAIMMSLCIDLSRRSTLEIVDLSHRFLKLAYNRPRMKLTAMMKNNKITFFIVCRDGQIQCSNFLHCRSLISWLHGNSHSRE